jgi:ABC-2 type transport system permease protein
MTSLGAVRLVAGREIHERLEGPLLKAITAVSALIVVLLIVIPAVRSSTHVTSVGIVGPTARSLGPAITSTAKALGSEVVVTGQPDRATEQAAVADGTLDVGVRIDNGTLVADVKSTLDATVKTALRAVFDSANARTVLGAAGVTAATVERALTPVSFSLHAISPPSTDPEREAKAGASVTAAVLLYVSLMIWGTMVAQGVAQEKTSRTAEVLVSAIRPSELLLGKVLGIGACGLGQMGVTVAAGLAATAAVHSSAIPSAVWWLLPAVLLWFLLGYAFYSVIFAAAGALVARQEEVGLVTAPFAAVVVGSYMLTFATLSTPDAPWVRLVSFLPPLSPILMTVRVGVGHVAWWEELVAVALMLVAISVTTRVAAQVYRSALVRSGARVGWRAALTGAGRAHPVG